jgi:hypothetical protein
MNYSDLIALVPTWMYAQNRDLTTEMPKIVDQAHRQLFNIVNHDFFRTKITGLILPTTGALDLMTQQPPVMEIRGVRLKYRKDDEWTPLMRRDLEMLSMLYAKNVPGRPRYYAESDGPLQLQVYPTPDVPYDVEVTCNQECPVIGPTLAQNLFTDRAARALEFATLKFAAIFMKDSAAIKLYESEMMAAVNELNAAYARHLRDDTAERPRDTTNTTGA